MQNESPDFSPRTIVFGALAFVLVTLGMLGLIEWIGVERIQKFIQDAGPLAPLAYIALKMATYIFAPLSSGPIQLSSGILFGFVPGVVYTMIGEVLGGSISFLIARHLGRPIVHRLVGTEGMGRVDQFVSQLGGWKALAYARLFLAAIYDFISYAAGFARGVTLVQYVLVSTLVGLIPTSLFVAAGTSLATNRNMVLVIYALLGGISLVPLAINWLRKRQANRVPHDAS
ncbi:MAG: VTT domain-containing protein [Anaerolineae bacterium]|nr:VTT domain-containing protein [Anaerolineae bacterium]